jgi:SAM-dependent methyltransferase
MNREQFKLESETAAAISQHEGPPVVLDACCGSRKFWFDPEYPGALFIDVRQERSSFKDPSKPDGIRWVDVNPDQVADFRDMPFEDESFRVVVFDPPHIKFNRTARGSLNEINYGTLGVNWKKDLRAGFRECFRVLKPEGVLIFKWAETNIPLPQVLALTDQRPLIGNQMPKVSGTHWITFLK